MACNLTGKISVNRINYESWPVHVDKQVQDTFIVDVILDAEHPELSLSTPCIQWEDEYFSYEVETNIMAQLLDSQSIAIKGDAVLRLESYSYESKFFVMIVPIAKPIKLNCYPPKVYKEPIYSRVPLNDACWPEDQAELDFRFINSKIYS